jgi:glutathione S-transferase
MPTLQIIGAPQSNFVWACRIACGEKEVPYELVGVFPHTPEVDAIHPFGKIPAMRHGDVTLCESRAILHYIDHAFPGAPLAPRDPVGAAQVEQWISLHNTAIDPVLLRQYGGPGYFFPGTPDGSPNRAVIDAVLPKLPPHFDLLDRAVAETGYLVGNGFTAADMTVLPLLYYMSKLPESGEMLKERANLAAYVEKLLARKTVADTIPPPMPGRS